MATILVVDDRPGNRQFLTTLLGYCGHRLIHSRLLGIGIAAALSATAAWAQPQATLVITGSSTMVPLVTEMARR